ncbi:guanine nucleotide exchange factor VAV2, partial [Biomphalaria glabrata]
TRTPRGDSYEQWGMSNGSSSPASLLRPPPGRQLQQQVAKLNSYPWYVGEMERQGAQQALDPLPDGTFLIRVTNNPARAGELSLSIKYANAVRHIKVNRTHDGQFYLAELRYFGSVQ